MFVQFPTEENGPVVYHLTYISDIIETQGEPKSYYVKCFQPGGGLVQHKIHKSIADQIRQLWAGVPRVELKFQEA